MKIVDGNLGALANAVSGAGQVQSPAGAPPGSRAGAVPADTAEVSGLAGKLAETASGESPERAAKVEALRAAVEAGRYQVDAESVARGLVNDALAAGGETGGETGGGTGGDA